MRCLFKLLDARLFERDILHVSWRIQKPSRLELCHLDTHLCLSPNKICPHKWYQENNPKLRLKTRFRHPNHRVSIIHVERGQTTKNDDNVPECITCECEHNHPIVCFCMSAQTSQRHVSSPCLLDGIVLTRGTIFTCTPLHVHAFIYLITGGITHAPMSGRTGTAPTGCTGIALGNCNRSAEV